MMVTREIFQSYLDCKYKAFHKQFPNTIPSKLNQYAMFIETLEDQYRATALNRLFPKMLQEVGGKSTDAISFMTGGSDIILLASITTQRYHVTLDALVKVRGKSNFGSYHYEPVLCIRMPSPSVKVKLMLGFFAIALTDIQNRTPQFGKIISGEECKPQKIRLAKFISQAKKVIDAIVNEESEPKLILNSHCRNCEYYPVCIQKARDTDNLSLIQSLSEKEILRLNAKGIFTVTQLSYTFRPRRKRKGPLILKDNPALRALAIRERKTYVVESPMVKSVRVALYVDIEGLPDENFVYLIGVLAVDVAGKQLYQFWADTHSDQEKIWHQFVNLINGFESPIIFHHGKYDAAFFKKMQAIHGGFEHGFLKDNVVNTVGLLFGRIFFPTFSNGLKDIANFLGFKWVSEDASGLQSIQWRNTWENSFDADLKSQIKQYNYDDCQALELLVNRLRSLDGPKDTTSAVYCNDLKVKKQFGGGPNEFAFPELELINKAAYFNYQQNKIYWRTDRDMKKRRDKKERVRVRQPRINKVITSKRPKWCPFCGKRSVVIHNKTRRIIYDLKFSESGVKRWVIQYRNFRFICQNCGKTFYPAEHPLSKEKYGHCLLAWVIYQYIGLRQSQERVANGIRDIFRIQLGKQGGIADFKKKAANLYEKAYKEILERLQSGKLIHVDETKVSIKGTMGYVWVFTNLEEVVYVYSASREAIILKEIIPPGFKGVVVSDYYPAYDRLECKQQRCLVHLIRDLNDDFFKNQFDEEFKLFVQKFSELLKPIIQTIDQYGLKKYYLSRHKKEVSSFFKYFVVSKGKSELTQKYQNRFIRNQDRLFTFLDHDGVPWNNNNAENAVKGFATLRKVIGGTSTEKGLKDSLLLLSICQTLRNKGHNSLEFFRSKDTSIYEFMKRFE